MSLTPDVWITALLQSVYLIFRMLHPPCEQDPEQKLRSWSKLGGDSENEQWTRKGQELLIVTKHTYEGAHESSRSQEPDGDAVAGAGKG